MAPRTQDQGEWQLAPYLDYCDVFHQCPDRETLDFWRKQAAQDPSLTQRTRNLLAAMGRKNAQRIARAEMSP